MIVCLSIDGESMMTIGSDRNSDAEQRISRVKGLACRSCMLAGVLVDTKTSHDDSMMMCLSTEQDDDGMTLFLSLYVALKMIGCLSMMSRR